jgi:hypothetical protein
VKERGANIEKLQDMLVWHNRTLPANALTYAQLVEQWIAAAKKQTADARDKDALRSRLRLALATEWPKNVLSERNGETIVLSREGKGDRVRAAWIGEGIPSTVVLNPDGGRKDRTDALVVTVFQTGDAAAPRDRSGEFFTTFNRTDDQNRVQDILTALAFLKQHGASNLRVIGTGRAAIWATFAAAVAQEPVVLEAKLENFAGHDQDFVDQFFVPGIQRAGGLDAARRVLQDR